MKGKNIFALIKTMIEGETLSTANEIILKDDTHSALNDILMKYYSSGT